VNRAPQIRDHRAIVRRQCATIFPLDRARRYLPPSSARAGGPTGQSIAESQRKAEPRSSRQGKARGRMAKAKPLQTGRLFLSRPLAVFSHPKCVPRRHIGAGGQSCRPLGQASCATSAGTRRRSGSAAACLGSAAAAAAMALFADAWSIAKASQRGLKHKSEHSFLTGAAFSHSQPSPARRPCTRRSQPSPNTGPPKPAPAATAGPSRP